MAAHKHAEVIKAWADGAEIEFRRIGSGFWHECLSPTWQDEFEYRIKPAEPERATVETQMTPDQLFEHFISAPGGDNAKACVIVANKAIQHALDRGQIVTRAEFNRAIGDRAARDMAVAKAVHDACVQGAINAVNGQRILGVERVDLEAVIANIE